MPFSIKPLGCDPARIKGMSERLIISHYENNYSGAVKRLNLIEEQLADPAIQAALRQAGTDPAELRDRLRELGDHDVHLLASRLDDVKSGGLITEVLVIVVLVLLILYLVKRV